MIGSRAIVLTDTRDDGEAMKEFEQQSNEQVAGNSRQEHLRLAESARVTLEWPTPN